MLLTFIAFLDVVVLSSAIDLGPSHPYLAFHPYPCHHPFATVAEYPFVVDRFVQVLQRLPFINQVVSHSYFFILNVYSNFDLIFINKPKL